MYNLQIQLRLNWLSITFPMPEYGQGLTNFSWKRIKIAILNDIVYACLKYQQNSRLGFEHNTAAANDLLNEIKDCYPRLFAAIDTTRHWVL